MSPEEIRKKIIASLTAQKTEIVRISDIMSFPVFSVAPETTMRQAQSLMTEKDIRGVMVVDDHGIQGIIVVWDLKKVKKKNQWDSPVKAFMARNITTIDPGDSPSLAARIMIEKDIGHLPVVQDEKMIGIVTRTDILTYYYALLPE
jgi:CBS domain-containing protein